MTVAANKVARIAPAVKDTAAGNGGAKELKDDAFEPF